MLNNENIFTKRRSIRSYSGEKISPGIINSILRDAMSGPSAMRRDPWEFIVIDDPAILSDVASFLPHGAMLKDASHGIIVCGDISKAHDNSLSYMLQDVSAAIENLLLSAEMNNIGSCWLGVHPREDRIKAISEYFKLPDNIIPVCAVALGFKAETKAPESRFDPKKIHFNRY